MMFQAVLEQKQHNFSKIGKYISNKLHHIHHPKSRQEKNSQEKYERKSDRSIQEIPKSGTQSTAKSEVATERKQRVIKRSQSCQPTVGSYRVNYSMIDKNTRQTDFMKTTPHFYGLKYRANQVTPLLKTYPDGFEHRQRGLKQLKRMVGRQQIKGSIRKNLQDPHENRFILSDLSGGFNHRSSPDFKKMTPRGQFVAINRQTQAQYNSNFNICLKRLDSHIIPFAKQTQRKVFKVLSNPSSEEFRYEKQNDRLLYDKTVPWSKQLGRETEGVMPSYMQRTVASRLALSLINLKTLRMNCCDMKQKPRQLRKRIHQEKPIYVQSEI